MAKEGEQFPSSPSNEEVSSISSPHQAGGTRRSQPPRIKAQKQKREEEDDDSNFDEEDRSDFDGDQRKNRQKLRKAPVAGIQHKAISKRVLDPKFKKIQTGTNTKSVAVFLYKPGIQLPSLSQYVNEMIEIRIAKEYINASNPALSSRLVWGGNGVYASHSDVVAMGVHHGLLSLNDLKLSAQLYEGVQLFCKVIKGKKSINCSFKSPILSRTLKQQCAHCLKPERILWLTSLGNMDQLVSWARKMAIPTNRRKTKSSLLSQYEPQQTPQFNLDQLLIKHLPPMNEGWLIWDMCNEPSQKFNVITFMDRQTSQGYRTNTSYKLRTHVLFIENDIQKYEIFMDEQMREEDVFLEAKMYNIAEIINPREVDLDYIQKHGLPVPNDHKQVVLTSLKWNDFIWGNDTLRVEGTDFRVNDLKSFKLIPLKPYR